MSMQSFLAKAGLRLSVLGSAASLAIAAPLAAGNPDPAAHTDASRIGVYFDRTAAAEKIGVVVMGAEILSVGVAGVTSTVKVITPASTALGFASLNLPHGVAPTVPVNGDMWTTTGGVFARVNGATQTLLSGSGVANQISYWTGTGTQGGNSGFTAVLTSGALLVNLTQTTTIAALGSASNALTVVYVANPASAATGTAAGASFTVENTAAAAANMTLGNLMAFRSTVNAQASVSGAIQWLFANRNVLNVNNTGVGTTFTVAAMYGFTIDSAMLTTNAGSTTTITDYFGVVINTPQFSGAGTATITNRWGIYSTDPAMTHLMGGFVRVGTLQPRVGNATVSATLSGTTQYVRFTGAAGQTFTLPQANIATAGFTPIITFKNTTAVSVNVTAGGANTLDGLAAGTPITLGPGASVTFMSSGVSAWESN